MIYFAQLPTGSIKIGFSDDVSRRMNQLGHHYGDEPSVIYTMPGGRDEERELHQRFAHLRFGRTEQFRPAADLMAFIGRPLLVTADPDSVEAVNANAVIVKLPADIMHSARIVAAYRGENMAELLNGILRPALAKIEQDEIAKRIKESARKGKAGDE